MTVVIAIRCSDGSVVMGADSFCGDENILDVCEEKKVYTIGPIGVGICGAIRTEQVLQRTLSAMVPDKKEVTEEWIRGELIEYVRESMIQLGAAGEEKGANSIPNSSFMLTFDGKIFFLDDDFGVWESQRSFASIGAGRLLANGAVSAQLLTTYGDLTSKPTIEEATAYIEYALIASDYGSPWVCPPFHIMVVPPVNGSLEVEVEEEQVGDEDST